jgi:hypothetical protein
MHEWWWFNHYESVNYPVHYNRLGSQMALLECINKLESVQQRAARFATGNYNATSSVTTMLNHLNLDTLQQCHLRTKAIMMYRIINGLVV